MTILVVGAGFSGATVARILAEAGRRIHVIDRRPHVAGNAYDEVNAHGIRVHRYGPHLFHTSNDEVVAFLSRFTEWAEYRHQVKAMLGDGRLVTLPVNRETSAIVGKENVLDVFFRPYTLKMWGVPLEAIDKDIVNRVPVRDDDNTFYFPNDTFQAMPVHGYTRLVEAMLDHPLITVRLDEAFDPAMLAHHDHTFTAMAIDEFFGQRFGPLPYRSIRFHEYTLPIPWLFPVATVNFTHAHKYTRVTEWKHLPHHAGDDLHTTITLEEPCDFADNNFERYYPVKDIEGANRALYERYKALVPPGVTFIGRCGLYAYLDMHQAVSSSAAVARRFLESGAG